ncbi:unnamed protein product [Oreochromis niloticus]|nr:unnamed protein product [Mustela putorius furo]
MMLSLLLLLALSSASPQDIVKKPSEDRNVTSLKPDLEEQPRGPEMTDISVNTSVYQHLLFPAKMKQKRQTSNTRSAVKWKTWDGSLPDGAVSIDNDYEKRTDYVCKYECHAGFYSSSLGDFCHYPYHGKEYRTESFDILVNEYDFEFLEWKEHSFGSMPAVAIRTCSSDYVYVGKNKYGLGKVRPLNLAFFLPWRGDEYWYLYYEALTVKMDIYYEIIASVKYETNDAKITRYPETMRILTTSNNGCNPVTKTVTFSKTINDDRWWDFGFLPFSAAPKTLETGIPNIVSGTIEISKDISELSFSVMPADTRAITHSAKVQVSIPPNHYCNVTMMAYKYNVNMPFTAVLSRLYRKSWFKALTISGTYHGIQVGEVRAVVEGCAHLSSAQSCPKKT